MSCWRTQLPVWLCDDTWHTWQEIYFKSYKSLTFIWLLEHKQACVFQFFSRKSFESTDVRAFQPPRSIMPQKAFLASRLHFSIAWSTQLEWQEVYSDFSICAIFSFYFQGQQGHGDFNYTVQCAERERTVLLLKVFCAHRPQPPCL